MKLVPVCCQNCGASLEIPGDARFVTCQFCRSRLAVQNTGHAIFTELLGGVTENGNLMAENLEVIRIQNEIEKLDWEWQIEKETHMIRGRRGRISEPNAAVSVVAGIFLILFTGGLCFSLPHTQGIPVAAVGSLMGIYAIVSGPIKAAAYEKAREAYLAKRYILQTQLAGRE